MKVFYKRQKPTIITYRIFKNFSNEVFMADVQNQHDLTPRIYVLHKITIALKFMSYINQ